MTLNCSAHSCIYNNSGACYAGRITVSGVHASNSSGTNCATFAEGNGSLSNNISSNYFTTSNDITCKAKNCHYNDEGTCVAESVHINNDNIQCDTFISK